MATALLASTGGDKDLFKKYWSGDIAKGAFNTKTGLFSKKFWTKPARELPNHVMKWFTTRKKENSATNIVTNAPVIFLTHIYIEMDSATKFRRAEIESIKNRS